METPAKFADLSALSQAVIRQMGASTEKHWEENAESAVDAANHGGDSGFPGFTYSKDCAEFVENNEDEIMDLVEEFGGLKEFVRKGDTLTQLVDRLAWLALESAGREIDDARIL